ncbi:MAG: pyridine nucleotide-disulfide oxidoreductase [Gammaproteobacteria bacterium]|nr:pyridine nucleotide-disulfide oxidoreductase [Gammaproteobacteria bacterium]
MSVALVIPYDNETMTETAATQTIVIVGAGQAGGETASELRKQGYAGRIVLVGEEPHVPYRRPPLSKAFLNGSAIEESLYLMPAAGWQKQNVEFIRGVRAQAIERDKQQLHLADGRSLAYNKLVLATGGRARMLNAPEADKPNVFAVRSIADVQALRPQCQRGKRAVIVGGGFIGLEVAAVLGKLGLHVTVLEGLSRVLARVTVPEVSAFFERVHREAGVDLRTNVQITAFEGGDSVEQVVLADGTRIPADFVIASIGQLPNVQLAQDAGLAVDNGIVVDEYARTSDPHIYAAGDCANHPNAFFDCRLRLESVQNAMEHGRTVAANLLGKNVVYNVVPWFWSDQYDLKLQMVGLSKGFDKMVVRGDLNGRAFAAFYLRGGRMIAADTVSRPQDFMFAKRLVAVRAAVDAAQLADEAVPLKAVSASS